MHSQKIYFRQIKLFLIVQLFYINNIYGEYKKLFSIYIVSTIIYTESRLQFLQFLVFLV